LSKSLSASPTYPQRPWADAVRKGFQAARQNLYAILGLQSAMALVVVIYYRWPAGNTLLSRYAEWQHHGGVFTAALASAFAGGALSETSVVYFQNRGRWTWPHLENMGFKMAMFFISGAVTYEFYQYQAFWFGDGPAWSILLPKILVDQIFYAPLLAVPYQTLLTRWQVLRYSGHRLGLELGLPFFTDRLLPVAVTSWMFWIPGVFFVYSMPLHLQMSLAIFATASWGILLAALAKPIQPDDETVHPLVVAAPEVLADSE
jgi:hypothetical protein